MNTRLEAEAASNPVPSLCPRKAIPGRSLFPEAVAGANPGCYHDPPVSQGLGYACGATSFQPGDCQDPKHHHSTKRNEG